MASTITNSSAIGSAILSSPGVGSGLDVNSIVSKLMAVEQQPIALLNQKEASFQTKITSWGNVKGALSSFQTSVLALNDPTKFQSTTADVGDSSVAAATASGTAVPGSYSLTVSQLAQAQKTYTAGFASQNSVVGSGTITFQAGTYAGGTFTPSATAAAKSVTIGAGQSSLASIRDAINAAGVGVTATIVNDGSASGNRLVLTGANGGAANALKITVADADGNNTDAAGLSQLAFDPAAASGAGKNQSLAIAAQDAKFSVDGIAFSKAANSVTDAIPGVTLNLSGTSTNGQATTISVVRDTASITKNVQSFVQAYNDLKKTFTSVASYDAASQSGGPLFGDAGIQLIQSQINGLLSGSAGSGTAFTNLSQIGVTFQRDGTLSLDSSKLQSALSSNFAQVAGLFASQGTPSDPQVQFVSAGAGARAGTYGIAVGALATQGKIAGQSAAGLTITAGVNDQLSVNVDGSATTVTLAAGTYATADDLAAQVQSAINGNATVGTAGSAVTVSQSGGVITVTSNRYGSASSVAIGGNGAASLLGASPTATAGTDIVGSIGGQPATGSGQTLTAKAGGGSDSIKVTVTGGATGARGNVTMSQGYAAQINSLLTQVLSSNGAVQASTDGINASIKSINDQVTRMNARLTQVEANYRAQFAALDTIVASMNTTSQYLTQQLSLITANSKA